MNEDNLLTRVNWSILENAVLAYSLSVHRPLERVSDSPMLEFEIYTFFSIGRSQDVIGASTL